MTVPKIWRKTSEYYNLIGKKCTECSSLYFPTREVCLKCGSLDLKNYKFKGKGTIVTFSIIRTAVTDPEGEISEIVFRNTPYIISIIRLDEGPMLTAEIVDCNLIDVEIGNKVEVVFRKLLEKGEKGVIQYGYKFKLIR